MDDASMIPYASKLGTGFTMPLAHGSAFFFFGNRDSSLANLSSEFAQFSFSSLHQTHSNIILSADASGPKGQKESSLDLGEGDGIITEQIGKALIIKTADCVPILIASKTSNFVGAVHAGWKGFCNHIVFKMMDEIQKKSLRANDLLVAIGPHIQKQSFEVSQEVCLELIQSLNPSINSLSVDSEIIGEHIAISPGHSPAKYLFDLHSAIHYQLDLLEIPRDQRHSFFVDTKTNRDYHSYRRDGALSGRNLSFVVRIK